MTEPALHPDLEPVAFLLGRWTGEGKGHYPSIDPFFYAEEAVFSHYGKPVLLYLQRTRSLADGSPLHSETGYWRPQPDGRTIEIVLTHAFGATEMGTGTYDDRRVEIVSRAITPTPTAKRIDEIRRVITIEGDEMTYEVGMAATGHTLQQHLAATLTRT